MMQQGYGCRTTERGRRVASVRRVEVDARAGAVITIDRPDVRNAIGFATVDELGARARRTLGGRRRGARASAAAATAPSSPAATSRSSAPIRTHDDAVDMATRVRRLLDRVATLPGAGGRRAQRARPRRRRRGRHRRRHPHRGRRREDRLQPGDASGSCRRGAAPSAWPQLVGRGRAMLLIATGTRSAPRTAADLGLVDVVAPREASTRPGARWRRAFGPAAGAGRSIKAVLAAARPSHHPALESAAVRHFARLWVGDEHWAAAGVRVPPRNPHGV